MYEVETLLPGAVIGDHYIIVDLVGRGGFSAVYLVQDQQHEEQFFALKEAIITHKEVRERFTFEYSVLEHLVHPALPRMYSVFDNEEHNRLYMLMDYVEGPNLEMLRRVQPDKRFSFPTISHGCSCMPSSTEPSNYSPRHQASKYYRAYRRGKGYIS